MAETLELEQRMKDIIWESVGFTPLDELFHLVNRYSLTKQVGIVDPEKLENYIKDNIIELTINIDGRVKPNLPTDSLWHATYAFRVTAVLAQGLELLAGSKDGYELDNGDLWPKIPYPGSLPENDPLTKQECIYLAVAPEHAVFKRGRFKGVSVLEIDPSNNNLIPVDTRGRPIEGDEDLIKEQFRYGTVDLGTHTPIHPDSIKRAYIHENDKSNLTPPLDSRITFENPKSPKQWNRVIAEHYAMTKG